MPHPRSIVAHSHLAADAARVWAHATAMPSINREIAPWMTMTAPRAVRDLSLADPRARPGEVLFDSWILLGGVLPVERMGIRLTELGPGFRFVEESRMHTLRSWRHEREVTATEDGCALHDRVTFEAPIAAFGIVLEPLLRAFFAHRHARLRSLFGVAPGAAGEQRHVPLPGDDGADPARGRPVAVARTRAP